MNIYKATDNIGPGHKAGTQQVPLSKKMKATVQELISNTMVTWHLFHIERILVSKMPLFSLSTRNFQTKLGKNVQEIS